MSEGQGGTYVMNTYRVEIRGVSPFTLIQVASKVYPITLLNVESFGIYKHEAEIETEPWVIDHLDFYKINDGTFISSITEEMRENV